MHLNFLENVSIRNILLEYILIFEIIKQSQVGHSLPEILERGLDFVKTVLDSGADYNHTIELMLHILPVLLTDVTALASAKLTYIMTKLVNADNSYLSMAKTMLTGEFPGKLYLGGGMQPPFPLPETMQ